VAHSELMEALAERLQPLSPDEVEPPDREHSIDGGVEGDELEVGEIVDEPLERGGPVVGLKGSGVQSPGIRLSNYVDGIWSAPADLGVSRLAGVGAGWRRAGPHRPPRNQAHAPCDRGRWTD
jgi:hypothetical protein